MCVHKTTNIGSMVFSIDVRNTNHRFYFVLLTPNGKNNQTICVLYWLSHFETKLCIGTNEKALASLGKA